MNLEREGSFRVSIVGDADSHVLQNNLDPAPDSEPDPGGKTVPNINMIQPIF